MPRTVAAALVLLGISGSSLLAQGGMSLLDDASLVPKGLLRLRAPLVWTRYDQRFGLSATTPLGAPYTADSLGGAQLPPLAAVATTLGIATGSTVTVSLGKSRLNSVAREEEIPFTLEYGVKRRLSVSLVVPVIRRRYSGLLQLDTTGGNLGPNPARSVASIATSNGQVQSQFSAARTQLQNQLNNCTLGPAACANLTSRQAEAQTLLTESANFVTAVGLVYGYATGSGSAFVPQASSSTQAAIAARVAAFNSQFQSLLSSSSAFVTQVPIGSSGPVSAAEVNAFALNEVGLDSLENRSFLGIGDVALGVSFLAIDRAPSTAGGFSARVLLRSTLRFPSGSRQDRGSVTDLRLGDGAFGTTQQVIGDVQRGRLGLLAAASYTTVGSNSAMRPTDLSRMSLDAEPRWQVSAPLSLHGSYAFRTADVTGNTQLAGGGVTFSTVSTYTKGTRPLPMEMRYSHLAAIKGDVGAAKFTRDQLEVRIYFRAFER